jgi:hypothetical protein
MGKKVKATAEGGAVRYGPPEPQPKIDDVVSFVRPEYRVTEATDPKTLPPEPVVKAKVAFVHEGLEGRVVNLDIPTADGKGEKALNVPFDPTESPTFGTWAWE